MYKLFLIKDGKGEVKYVGMGRNPDVLLRVSKCEHKKRPLGAWMLTQDYVTYEVVQEFETRPEAVAARAIESKKYSSLLGGK